MKNPGLIDPYSHNNALSLSGVVPRASLPSGCSICHGKMLPKDKSHLPFSIYAEPTCRRAKCNHACFSCE